MGSAVALPVVDVRLGMFGSPFIPPVHNGERLLERIPGLVSRVRDAGVPVGDEPVIRKRTPDSFHETTLRQELERRGVEGLIPAGIQTEYCVDTTCRRDISLGYDVTLVRDVHRTWERRGLSADRIIAHRNRVLAGWFATAVDADEVRLKAAG